MTPTDEQTRAYRTDYARRRRETDPEFRQRQTERDRVYSARRYLDPVHRQKARVRWQIRKAAKCGRIERQNCALCGAEAVPHHPDYSRPFFVVWLCREHHELVHRLGRDGDILGVAAIERHAAEMVLISRRERRKIP